MSILLSAITPRFATQVSDMQVTSFADGKPLSSTQRKSIAFVGSRVRCLVGWTGLAIVEGYNTGDWLHGQLDALSQEDPSLQVLIESLTNSATLQFAMLRTIDKRCAFSLAGWFQVLPDQYAMFAAEISNYEVYPWQLSSSHSVRFQYAVTTQKRPSKHPYVLTVSGDERTSQELPLYTRGIRGLLKRRVGIDFVSGACRQMAEAVSARQSKKKEKDSRYVKTVGDSQLTVEMAVDGSVNSFSSKDGIITHSLPADVICPVITTKDMQVNRSVDADGTIRLNIKGWIKTSRPNIAMVVPGVAS